MNVPLSGPFSIVAASDLSTELPVVVERINLLPVGARVERIDPIDPEQEDPRNPYNPDLIKPGRPNVPLDPDVHPTGKPKPWWNDPDSPPPIIVQPFGEGGIIITIPGVGTFTIKPEGGGVFTPVLPYKPEKKPKSIKPFRNF